MRSKESRASNATDGGELVPGTRVRLTAPAPGLQLSSDTGTIVRPDEWDGYYVVRLDAPARYDHGDEQPEELLEVCEAADNMDVLAPAPRRTVERRTQSGEIRRTR